MVIDKGIELYGILKCWQSMAYMAIIIFKIVVPEIIKDERQDI